jgi:hypothetical protein
MAEGEASEGEEVYKAIFTMNALRQYPTPLRADCRVPSAKSRLVALILLSSSRYHTPRVPLWAAQSRGIE